MFLGLLNYLRKQKAAGALSNLVGSDGIVNCVFICCDLPYQYIDEYFTTLSTDNFHPIHNQVSYLKTDSKSTSDQHVEFSRSGSVPL